MLMGWIDRMMGWLGWVMKNGPTTMSDKDNLILMISVNFANVFHTSLPIFSDTKIKEI